MKKIALLLVLLLLLSACGKVDDAAKAPEPDDTVQEATPSPDTQEETPPPSEEPSAAPSEEPGDEPLVVSPRWDLEKIEAPAVPLDGESCPVGMVKLKDTPAQYDAQQAMLDGCVVIKNGESSQTRYNEFIYEAFLADSALGRLGAIRKVDDNSERNGGYNIRDIQFDGKQYIVRKYVRDEALQVEYEFVTAYERVNDNLDELFPLYASAEEAAQDGCEVRDEYGELLYGEQALEDFINKVKNGEKALYRKVCVWSNGTGIFVEAHLEFDGQYFISKSYNEYDNTVVSEIYTHMIESPSVSIASMSRYNYTILVCSEKYTYDYVVDLASEAFGSGNFEAAPAFETLAVTEEPIPIEELEKTEWVPEDESHLSDEPLEYTVLPGTDEWKNMSVDERIASCSQDAANTKGMTTRALIETALNYPYIVNIYAYNTLEMGIEAQLNNNVALGELFTRDNAFYELVMYRLEFEGSEYNSKIMDIETIIRYYEQNLLTQENNPWPHLAS